MKAILVIDMPNECDGCPCINQKLWECQADPKRRSSCDDERPSWCPIKPLPQKQKHLVPGALFLSPQEEKDYDYGFVDGYNACIEEIENG